MDYDEEGVVCTAYTFARRHPKVLGVVQGHALPFTSTYTQAVSVVVITLALLTTHKFWGPFLPFVIQPFIVAGLPIAAWFVAKHWTPDQRSPARALVDATNFYSRSRHGTHMGRRVHAPRPQRVGGGTVYFCGGPR